MRRSKRATPAEEDQVQHQQQLICSSERAGRLEESSLPLEHLIFSLPAGFQGGLNCSEAGSGKFAAQASAARQET